MPPHNTAAIQLDNCGQVELLTGVVNLLASLTNITITNTNTLTLQPRVNRDRMLSTTINLRESAMQSTDNFTFFA